MARAQTRHDWSDQQRAPGNEWQQLRHDLVALLDQAEQQQSVPDPAIRPQHSSYVDEDSRRRSDALRSVKQAVDRFATHDEAFYPADGNPGLPDDNPRAALRDAIDQIRSKNSGSQLSRPARGMREFDSPAPQGQSTAAGTPQFSELARAVSGISGRLERLEMELRASRKSEADIAEISKQVSQLTNVVEMVAGAVGETSQIKRLEKQIGQLASTMAQAPKTDASALTKRIDEVAATVDRLAEMQVQQLGRDARETPVDLSRLDASMESIEASVRNIYDRIDALERSFSLSPQDIERLTGEMAEFTQALRDGPGGAPSLLARVDALNARLGQIEDGAGDGSLGDIRADVSSLRDAVAEAVEPRFAAIESQIEALSGRMGTGGASGGGDLDVAQLEDQIRQLAQRMDQTGEQLTGLTRLYEQDSGEPQDYEALAALVAQRTSQEMARSGGDRNLSEDSVSQLEERLSRLFATGGQSGQSEEIADMRTGIEQVDARLERLEAVLSALGDKSAVPPAPSVQRPGPSASSMAADSAPSHRTRISLQPDNMPNNPGDEAPLRDPGFPPPQAGGDWEKMEVASSLRDPSEAVTTAAREPARDTDAEPPRFDPDAIERPERPKSSFDEDQPDPFAETDRQEPAVEPEPEWPQSGQPQQVSASKKDEPRVTADRNTFIAAARRAAIRQQEQPAETPSGNSLIGRAFARLQQKSNPGQDEQAAPMPEPPAGERPGRHSYALSADGDETPGQSMLSRHRRPILLAAALVAVSLLTLNLVTQRMSSSTASTVSAPAPAAMQPNTPETTQSSDPGIDSTPTNSIDPMVKMDLMKPSPAGQPLPMMLQQGAAEPGLPLSEFTTSSIRPIARDTSAEPAGHMEPSPIKHELAPEEIGPLALRDAAANGDARAQFEIAAIYAEGQSVEQDFDTAATWYERAAAQGFAPAAYRLGTLYEHGRGLDRDLQQAKLWYQRAADAGNRMAMHNLAAIHAGGELEEQDFSTAAQWFQAAAERGMMDSQFNLGMLYARGLGVPQNLEQSYKWFSLAAAQGDEDAAKARDDVTRSLDADSVIALQEVVAGWSAQPIDMQANFAPIGTWDKDFNPGDPISERSVVEKVQAALNRLGFDVGTPDGLMGPKTREAIRAFESATGMSESGAVNPRLLAVLGSQPV